MNAERARLAEADDRKENWQRWGPYLSDRQWGTVREDYSGDGDTWNYFTHDQAVARAYRWGEDGLLGITDRQCRLCFALAMWNGNDPILKERLYGLTNHEGNHGEDVKECYWYLDATPTSSYLKALYRYPIAEFPYRQILEGNRQRSRNEGEFELIDTGVLNDDRFFDVTAEYAKAGPDDILVRLTVSNASAEEATIRLLPTLWFRNTWVWGCQDESCWAKPRLQADGDLGMTADHPTLDAFRMDAKPASDGTRPELLFTENESNNHKLFGSENFGKYTKDAFHEYVIRGNAGAVNPKKWGTKGAWHYTLKLAPGQSVQVELRLRPKTSQGEAFGDSFDAIFRDRIAEADAFYAVVSAMPHTPEENRVSRQAYAGLLWSKQFYYYVVEDWLAGDPDQPSPPSNRAAIRNGTWKHFFARDILSMPDKWEYPWFAAWDSAFHMLPMARIDPAFAKDQLLLFLREWYSHPNGQLPAYEYNFGDVNPPVHAWGCWRVYKLTAPRGQRDTTFLARAFHKLLINFTWWVNRKDDDGNNLFSGGFLGMDNVGVFDRSQQLPTGGSLEQADGSAWMAFYCLTMLDIALELAKTDPAYEDVASKFFEHFVAIADAMNSVHGTGMWDDEDGFYHDQLRIGDQIHAMRVRSMVGLVPLFAVLVVDDEATRGLVGFRKRMKWFLDNRKDLGNQISYMEPLGACVTGRRLLAIPSKDRLIRVLKHLFDEAEFLSPFGIRSLSKFHEATPYIFKTEEREYRVNYVPGEDNSGMFGGNSNWRGPVWFPMNYLIIESLQRYHYFYGDNLKVEFPTGSGNLVNLNEAAMALAERLTKLFLPTGADPAGAIPSQGLPDGWQNDPRWSGMLWFHEYFHGDTGRGLGASHQTGWTALVAKLLK
jgi:Glycosyl hydrolase family 63 C-terminal domain